MSDGSSFRKVSFSLTQVKIPGYITANKHRKTLKSGKKEGFPGISGNEKSHDDESSGFFIASYILHKTP